jgi:hypothetical protein
LPFGTCLRSGAGSLTLTGFLAPARRQPYLVIGMKERPNHRIYIRVLRDMGPEKRLKKAFELSEFSRALTRQGLEHLHRDLEPDDLNRLYLDRLRKAWDRVD